MLKFPIPDLQLRDVKRGRVQVNILATLRNVFNWLLPRWVQPAKEAPAPGITGLRRYINSLDIPNGHADVTWIPAMGFVYFSLAPQKCY